MKKIFFVILSLFLLNDLKTPEKLKIMSEEQNPPTEAEAKKRSLSNEEAFDKWYNHICAWEGDHLGQIVYVDQDDVATNHGIRFTTWSRLAPALFGIAKEDLWRRFTEMTEEEHKQVAFFFWRDSGAFRLTDGRCASIVAESYWGSYIHGGREMQRQVNKHFNKKLVVDGVIGPNTARTFNEIADQDSLFCVLVESYRKHYVKVAGKSKGYYSNLNGWLSRLFLGTPNRKGFLRVFG